MEIHYKPCLCNALNDMQAKTHNRGNIESYIESFLRSGGEKLWSCYCVASPLFRGLTTLFAGTNLRMIYVCP